MLAASGVRAHGVGLLLPEALGRILARGLLVHTGVVGIAVGSIRWIGTVLRLRTAANPAVTVRLLRIAGLWAGVVPVRLLRIAGL